MTDQESPRAAVLVLATVGLAISAGCTSDHCEVYPEHCANATTTTTTETTTETEESTETGPICGDGVVEGDEQCDGSELAGQDCVGLGFFGGDLACTDDCMFDDSACQMDPVCGNGVVEGDEVCDGEDFGGEVCESFEDFIGGALVCNETCDAIGTLGCLSPGEGGMCEFNADCPLEAPACVNAACWNGSETDPCDLNADCQGSCVNNQCTTETGGEFTLTSPAFAEGGAIPTDNSCYGDNMSPQLDWTDAPAEALSFAVFLEDLSIDFAHWAIFDVPADATGLPADVDQQAMPADVPGATQPRSYANYFGYAGPCPVSAHMYQFTVYAIDVANLAEIDQNSSLGEVKAAFEAHMLASATLSGEFTPP